MQVEVAVVGAGIAGIATAYHLWRDHGIGDIALIDPDPPMSLTSAQSGENYRNWWPHPAMAALADRSIDLMERLARETGNRIGMTRRGYALATRGGDIAPLIEELERGMGAEGLRFHDSARAPGYRPAGPGGWQGAPEGVDILTHGAAIRAAFPAFAPEIRAVIHIRRGGDIASQQMGAVMLEALRGAGARLVRGRVTAVAGAGVGFELAVEGVGRLRARRIVNAAGPFAQDVAAMLGTELPIEHSFQQKLAFEDRLGAVPRDMPFAIDLDAQMMDWSDEERAALRAEPALAPLAGPMPGAIHCRPDGGAGGRWVRLGWAFNQTPERPARGRPLDDTFPEIVLRGAARLIPALKQYYGRLPRARHHYGGWYSRTEENWPLIGPSGPEGVVVIAALSGFGTMMACAAGELAAAWVAGAALPGYAAGFSLARHDDAALMTRLRAARKGVL